LTTKAEHKSAVQLTKSAKDFDDVCVSARNMVGGYVTLFENPFVLRVKEAIERVHAVESRISMLKGQLKRARAQYDEEIRIYNQLLADLETVQETEVASGDVWPTCEGEIKRELRKDQRRVVRTLKEGMPDDLREVLQKHNWRVVKQRADENAEYLHLIRTRAESGLRDKLEQRRDTATTGTLDIAVKGQSVSELVEEAIQAGLAFKERCWPKHILEDDHELNEVDPGSDIASAHQDPVPIDDSVNRRRRREAGYSADDVEWAANQPATDSELTLRDTSLAELPSGQTPAADVDAPENTGVAKADGGWSGAESAAVHRDDADQSNERGPAEPQGP
jgi:hypothetical protein